MPAAKKRLSQCRCQGACFALSRFAGCEKPGTASLVAFVDAKLCIRRYCVSSACYLICRFGSASEIDPWCVPGMPYFKIHAIEPESPEHYKEASVSALASAGHARVLPAVFT